MRRCSCCPWPTCTSGRRPDELLNGEGTRVLIIEDHDLLAQSLGYALQGEGLVVQLAPLGSEEQVVAAADGFDPDVALLDLDLGPPIGTGLRLVQPLVERGAHVIVVTASESRTRIAECLEAGACGFVRKAQPFEQLVAAVTEAAALQSLLSKEQRLRLLDELRMQRRQDAERLAAFARLTPREQAVLRSLQEGSAVEAIAAASFVSVATVRSQVQKILQKLGVGTQLAAVAEARRAGWD